MTANLINILLLLVAAMGGWLFWSWRKQEEYAKRHILHLCKGESLQFLDLSRVKGKPVWNRGLAWQAEFSFGFSSDGETRYEGTIYMVNLKCVSKELPVYRVPQEPSPEPERGYNQW
ncbi:MULTISPECIES: DUF3301 domain-containing protein [Gammaproteobacteria]|uniref:DUF3301 domain-containing protein n=1 Tax=Gammaproteobacteria TaxID=1236 RepID=UPI000DD0460F|nr:MULTISPECIES: DUF3301 domain-containing protein [Gammaproteobacteria]RTE86986.1 DUF3301 domain-containing protein [Aliidiomarina sp. B3213]TCZ93224.1 DUF3301 domain-containing protein [Lysobacter sp. N42]